VTGGKFEIGQCIGILNGWPVSLRSARNQKYLRLAPLPGCRRICGFGRTEFFDFEFSFMSSRPRVPFWFLAFGAVVCVGSFFFDDAVIGWVGGHVTPEVKVVARFFTKWGDFPPIVGVLVVLALVAWVFKRPFVMRLVLLMVGCAMAGGLAANVLRVLTGRARPSAKAPAGWYGMRDHGVWIAGSYGYSSFPSAHTAVAIACVVPLWVFLRGRMRVLVAGPATGIAVCVAASRILLNAHHLSDVLVSVWIGAVLGMVVCARVAGWVTKGS
jgi:membrane-associated phospholipid phosphatase